MRRIHMKEKLTFTPREVAETYGTNQGTLANLRWRKAGAKYFKVGKKKIIYRREDLERWLFANPVHTIDSVKE
jgi:hypothetical protein